LFGLVKKKKYLNVLETYKQLLGAEIKKLQDGYMYLVVMPGCDTPTLQRIQIDVERMLISGGFTNITIKLFGREDSREASIQPPIRKVDLKELEPPKIKGGKKNGKNKPEKRDSKKRKR